MTMTTVGYGDITPQNQLERAAASIFMFVSGGVLSYILTSIGYLLQKLNKHKTIYSRSLNIINDYMMRNKVRLDLQIRVRSYLQYIYQVVTIHYLRSNSKPSFRRFSMLWTNWAVICRMSCFSRLREITSNNASPCKSSAMIWSNV